MKKLQDTDLQEVIKYYETDNLSLEKVSDKLGVRVYDLKDFLIKHNMHIRNKGELNRKYPINEDFFDNIDTQEKAYTLGFIYADGCNKFKKRKIVIRMSAVSKNIVEKISALIFKNNSNERIKEKSEKFSYISKKTGEKVNTINKVSELTINSAHMCKALSKLGCVPNKSLILTFPTWLTDPELQRHFIRGFYDGDGGISLNINKEKDKVSARITSTLSFLTTIKQIVKQQLGIEFGTIQPNGTVFITGTSGFHETKLFLDWLYDGSIIHLDAKYNRYLALKQFNQDNGIVRHNQKSKIKK